jgi:hypothetical protein
VKRDGEQEEDVWKEKKLEGEELEDDVWKEKS